MRWQALFDDLEAQMEREERAELESEVRDRSRREAALVLTADRLRAARGTDLVLGVLGAQPVRGRLEDVGRDWLLMRGPEGRELLVPIDAVLSVAGLGRHGGTPGTEVERRLDLRWALRALARDRVPVQVALRDESVLTGTLDRVGADHVDLAEHGAGEARRATAVTGVRLVPLHAVALVRQG